MEIFSHNTMTYRRPVQWWLRPFAWIARCQSENYITQYERGARYFDLRIRFNEEGDLEFGHGIFRYAAYDIYSVILWMKTHAKGVRLHLEHSKGRTDDKLFIEWCKTLERQGFNIFGGCCRNRGWEQLYEFEDKAPEIVDCYSSETAWCKWFPKLDDLWPWLYAAFHNYDTIEKYKDTDKIIMIDFI